MAETIAAAPQPVETPQQSGGEKKSSSGNLTGAQAAHRFMQMDLARQAEATAAEKTTPPASAETPEPPAAEETTVSPAEPEVTATEEAQAEPKAKTEGEDVPSPETSKSSLTPEQQEKFDRRIGKEVAKRKVLEEQLHQLQAQLLAQPQKQQEEVKPAQIVPLPAGAPPLANINDISGLLQLQQQAKETKRWVEEQLDRDDLGNGVQIEGKTISRSDLKGMMRRASVVLEDEIPQRAQFLQLRNESQQKALERYPFLKDPASPEYQHAQAARKQYPWIDSLPYADEMIGRQIMGLKYEQMLADAKTKGKAPAKAPPKPSGDQTTVSADSSTTRVPVTTQIKQQRQAVDEKFKAKGALSAKDAVALLSQREQLKNR